MSHHAAPYRPRVAPETRRLLIAASIALATLWGLARIRFPDTLVTASPVPPLLAQLAPPPTFEQLASEVSHVRTQVADALVTIPAAEDDAVPLVALRVRTGVAATIVPPAPNALLRSPASDIVARDPATGLVLVTVPDAHAPVSLPAWIPPNLDDGQFLLATTVSPDRQISFVPVFVSGMSAQSSRAWRGSVWELPTGTPVPAGAFVFTTDGELAGVTVNEGAARAIVPADLLRVAADALGNGPAAGGGWLGVDVGMLTRPIARATGTQDGVIVSWVDPRGPAARLIAPGDVIEAVQSDPIDTPEQWSVAIAPLAPGVTVTLRVRSNGMMSDVVLTTAAPPPPAPRALGLRLRRVARTGAEIAAVDAGSAAARAGLEAGDVITRAGALRFPSPSDIRHAYAAATPDHPLLVAVTHGAEHRVVTLQP